MKLLTFLGIANYAETTYIWNDQQFTSKFAPAASCVFLKPESITVFLTEDAHQQVFPELRASLPTGVKQATVSIPLGADEQELWQIFDQVSRCVEPGEEVAFDITHGLRSFPLLGLLVAAFLRSGLNVRLKAVLYGAYDVGRVTSPGKTPMFDLSPMISLLEWSASADRFNRTGDSRYLASLIKKQRKNLAEEAHGDRAQLEQVGHLGNLAGSLTAISSSLQLNRPVLALEMSAGLTNRIEKARPVLARSVKTLPFSLLLDTVEKTYSPLGLNDPLKIENLSASLYKQRLLVRWYLEREHWTHTVTLAREWMVNWFMFHLGVTQIMQQDARRRVEDVLNSEAKELITAQQQKTTFNPLFLREVPNAETALDLWNRIVYVRNDIDHAGFREQPLSSDSLIEQIQVIVSDIEKLTIGDYQP